MWSSRCTLSYPHADPDLALYIHISIAIYNIVLDMPENHQKTYVNTSKLKGSFFVDQAEGHYCRTAEGKQDSNLEFAALQTAARLDVRVPLHRHGAPG